MPGTNDLQLLLDSFGSDLKSYIRSEVKRQVTESMSSMDLEEEEAAVGGDTTTDDYLTKLTNLNKSVSEAVQPVVQKTGMDYAMDLLNSYKNKFSK
jgi:hypothetical protein